LNETGKSLELHDKIRARVVAKFNMGSDEAKWFDELVQKFGENSDKIKDYLVDYLLAIESDKIYKKGTVSQNLLQAFSTRSSNRRPIDSKLVETDDHNPRDFIRAINEHADKYNEISSDSEEPGVSLNDAYFSTDQIQHECEAIIEDLDSEQWKPFVLLMYIELAQGSPIVSETFFRDMLRLVERIMLRSSFSPAVATAIDKTFIAACVKYNTTSIPEFDKISVYDSDEEWIEEIDEFSDDPKRNMEAHMIQASDWDALSGGSLIRSLQSPKWSNTKSVLKKIARHHALSQNQPGHGTAIQQLTSIDFSQIEREHVFPKSPKISNAERPYNWFKDFFLLEDSGEAPSQEVKSVYKDLTSDSGDSDSNHNHDRLMDLSEKFIQDIGNSIVLQDSLNNIASNRQFSIKIIWYYLRSYNDLQIFGEYLGDPDNIGFEISDFIKLLDSFHSELSEGELALLLKEAALVFDTVSDSDIAELVRSVDLEEYSDVSQSQFESEFSSLSDFYTEFELLDNHYDKLRDSYEHYGISGASLESDEDDEERVALTAFINKAVESVISKLASNLDETSIEDNSDENREDASRPVGKFNKLWNWKTIVDRKAHLVIQVKKFLELDTVEDEFREYESEGKELEFHRERVKEAMRY
jgi:hypothetical protein